MAGRGGGTTAAEVEEEDRQYWEGICSRLVRNDPTLNALEFDGASPHLDEEVVASLSDGLRIHRRITSLKLRNLEFGPELSALLVPGLKNNRSLEVLECEDSNDPDGAMADAVSVALFYNKSIHTLHLRGCQLHPTSTSLGFLVEASQILTELRICHNATTMNFEMTRTLALGLGGNARLRTLDLSGNGLDDDAVGELARGLAVNGSVEFLSLDFNSFGDNGVGALAGMLKVNTRLNELHLFGNRVSALGAEHLADALLVNRTLQSLILSFNKIGDRGALALAQALTVNTTLTNLWFPSNSVGCEGMQAFAEQLPKMDGLEQLNVGLLLDDEAAEALTTALKSNLRLSILYMEKPVYESEESEADSNRVMDFYLRLNRSGRRLLREDKAAKGLWANILSRTAEHTSSTGVPDVLYYLLREKPELLIGQYEEEDINR